MRHTALSALPLLLALLTGIPAAWAHHPGDAIDEVMSGEERFFQAIDAPAPPFELVDMDGNTVRLSDLADKVVVLDLVFASCTDLCPLQSEVLADVQGKVNASPLADRVQFITVTTDPEVDTPEALRAYGETHGLDPVNWTALTIRPTDGEDATRVLSEAFDNTFTPSGDGQQMHGVVFHVIDRDGRLAAKFHGLRFEPVNMVLYISELTNAQRDDAEPGAAGWWERLTGSSG